MKIKDFVNEMASYCNKECVGNIDIENITAIKITPYMNGIELIVTTNIKDKDGKTVTPVTINVSDVIDQYHIPRTNTRDYQPGIYIFLPRPFFITSGAAGIEPNAWYIKI